MLVLVDMDEVLVDYISGALKVHKVTPQQLAAKRKPGHWNIAEALSIPEGDFWKPINDIGSEFWEALQPLPWAEKLVGLIEAIGWDWYVVTSPSREPESYSGKVRWLKNFFGKEFDRIIPTKYKWLLAGEGRVLIDDREKNCVEFEKVGGASILFPSAGNFLYVFQDRPLEYVSHRLEGLKVLHEYSLLRRRNSSGE